MIALPFGWRASRPRRREAPIAWLSSVRRTGKTTLAHDLDEARTPFVNCDLPAAELGITRPTVGSQLQALELPVPSRPCGLVLAAADGSIRTGLLFPAVARLVLTQTALPQQSFRSRAELQPWEQRTREQIRSKCQTLRGQVTDRNDPAVWFALRPRINPT